MRSHSSRGMVKPQIMVNPKTININNIQGNKFRIHIPQPKYPGLLELGHLRLYRIPGQPQEVIRNRHHRWIRRQDNQCKDIGPKMRMDAIFSAGTEQALGNNDGRSHSPGSGPLCHRRQSLEDWKEMLLPSPWICPFWKIVDPRYSFSHLPHMFPTFYPWLAIMN